MKRTSPFIDGDVYECVFTMLCLVTQVDMGISQGILSDAWTVALLIARIFAFFD